MAAGFSTRCPNCRATLKVKSAAADGKPVRCPKCDHSFKVRLARKPQPAPTASSPEAGDDINFEDLDLGEDSVPTTAPAPVRGRPKKRRPEIEEPDEEEASPSLLGSIFRALICVNAHFAIAAVVLDGLWDLFWMATHWSEFQAQMVTFRFARGQLMRPVLLIASAGYIWWQAVLPRDIGMRPIVSLFAGGYIVLFGLVAFLIALMAESLYDRPIYAVDWGVVYLGFSLAAFASWGFPPETTLQRAERLTSYGQYSDALTVVNEALAENPDDQDAYELQQTLRDLMRYG